MQSKVNIWRDFDFALFGVTLLLVIIGILFIRSATLDAVDTDLINRVPSQIQFTIIGIGVVFGVASLDYRLLGSLHGFLYGFILFILGLVAGLGAVGAAGAQSWLNVGLQVQPAELGKMLLVITLGQHLTDRYVHLANAVMRAARKRGYDVGASLYAYNQSERPPRRLALETNAFVSIVPTTLDLDELEARFSGWARAGAPALHLRKRSCHRRVGFERMESQWKVRVGL